VLLKEMNYKSITYNVIDKVARITLNRPARLNAIDEHMPIELSHAVHAANWDDDVKVIVVTGAGKAFCSGYDLKKFAEAKRGTVPGSQEMPWDPYIDYKFMSACQTNYMSLWHSGKPTIARINGDCVAGGTDIALCCDITIMVDTGHIGYPPARLWGCPTGQMWYYRLGLEKAKRMLLTGELITGAQAASIGLIGESCTSDKLDATVDGFIAKMRGIPSNQLFFQKLVINNDVELHGLHTSQKLATLLDGMTRHTPEGVEFQKLAHEKGFKQAIFDRDTTSKL